MEFTRERPVEESLKIITALSWTCVKLGGPLTLQMYNLLVEGRFLELIEFQIDYSWNFTTNDFLYARQIKAFVEKQDFIDLGIDRREVAFSKFLASEEKCRETNLRLELNRPENPDVSAVLHYASRKISSILGAVPSIESLNLSFGPGANTSTKSDIANPRVKMSSRLECSSNLIPLVGQLLEQLPMLTALHCTEEDQLSWTVGVTLASGKLAFVPKNSRGDRSIVIEPALNGLIQKGVGTFMKKRLSRAGIDLTDQTRNQMLARTGSIDGSLATVDLSSASDCVSRELVWSLLPYDWASLLDQIRSETVAYDDKCYLLEKFSSMGNATTFELESLIFYGLTYGVCYHLKLDQENVSVYGDDIIVPAAGFSLLKDVLEYCGFSLNKEKSFSEGPFRESCGADYLNGFDIRPCYVKTRIADRNLFQMHNWFVRSGELSLSRTTFHYTHPPVRIFGPDGYGDGHLIGTHSLRRSRSLIRKGFEGGVFDTYTLKPRSFKKVLPGDYVYPSYSIYAKGDIPTGFLADSCISDPDRIRGTRGYAKLSIYTLATSIFGRASHEAYCLARVTGN